MLKAPLFNMSIRRAELCIARALAGPLNRLLRHGGGWLFWGSGGPAACICSAGIDTPSPPAASGGSSAAARWGWVGRLGINAKLRAAGGGGVMRYHGFMHFLPFFSQRVPFWACFLPSVLSFLGCKAVQVPLFSRPRW